MEIDVDCVCSLWFLRPDCARSLLKCLCPFQMPLSLLDAFVLRSPLELVIMPLLGGKASPNSVPFRHPDLDVQYHPWSKVRIRGQPLLLHSMGRAKDWATWELIRGLGILVHPSPPVQAYLWTTSFIGRIFSGLHTG